MNGRSELFQNLLKFYSWVSNECLVVDTFHIWLQSSYEVINIGTSIVLPQVMFDLQMYEMAGVPA